MTVEGMLYMRQGAELDEELALREAVWRENKVMVNTEYAPVKLKLTARVSDSGRLVGLAQVDSRNEGIGEFSFQVHPEFQGQGIGTDLIEQMIPFCRDEGITDLRATAIPGSVSERVLRQNGFIAVDPGEKIRQLMGKRQRTFLQYQVPKDE